MVDFSVWKINKDSDKKDHLNCAKILWPNGLFFCCCTLVVVVYWLVMYWPPPDTRQCRNQSGLRNLANIYINLTQYNHRQRSLLYPLLNALLACWPGFCKPAGWWILCKCGGKLWQYLIFFFACEANPNSWIPSLIQTSHILVHKLDVLRHNCITVPHRHVFFYFFFQ